MTEYPQHYEELQEPISLGIAITVAWRC